MSNPTRPEPSDDETLAALHGLGASQDSGEHEAQEDAESPQQEQARPGDETGSSLNASGFVGMLANQAQTGPAEPHPDPAKAAAAGDIPLRASLDEIHMAREIHPMIPPPGAPGAVLPPAPRMKARSAPPGWYHIATPLMYTLGSLLILIGLWAIGALIYMAVKAPVGPDDVGYWGLRWDSSPDSPTGGAYDWKSKVMSFAMLVCLPVSLVMWIMAGWMRRQTRAARGRRD